MLFHHQGERSLSLLLSPAAVVSFAAMVEVDHEKVGSFGYAMLTCKNLTLSDEAVVID